ncbi:MAG: hypothetical protein WCJ13_06255 [Coriobacteriia bacterium]
MGAERSAWLLPNSAGTAPWPPYETEQETVLTLGETIEARSSVNCQGLDFFDAYWSKVLGGELPMPH